MNETWRWLVVGGVVLVVIGLYLRLGGPVPPLGRLPGDIVYRRGGSVIFVPITTMILVSVVLTVILGLLSRLR